MCGVLELLGNVGEELVGDTTADNDGAIGTVVVLVEVLGQGLKGLLALGWEVDGVGSVATLEVEGIGKTALEDIYCLYKEKLQNLEGIGMEGLRDWALSLVSSRLPGVGHLPLEEDWLSDRWNNDVKGQLVDGFWTGGNVDNGALASARGSQRSAHEVGHLKTWLRTLLFSDLIYLILQESSVAEVGGSNTISGEGGSSNVVGTFVASAGGQRD